MNRRRFLRNIALGLAALHLQMRPAMEAPIDRLIISWSQTKRETFMRCEEYTKAMAEILAGHKNAYFALRRAQRDSLRCLRPPRGH